MEGQKRIGLVSAFIIILLIGSVESIKTEGVAAVVGAVGLLGTVTGGILALGFGPAGIAAGSIAAKMMSASAVYGVGASAVAAGQSVGAAGLALGSKAAIVSTGAAVGYKVASWFR